MNVLRTIIVPAADVITARTLGAALAASGAGMYVTGLSASGLTPASRYVSSGLIGAEFAAILNNPAMLLAAAQAGAQEQGITLNVTLSEVESVVAASIVHDGTHPTTGEPETPHELFARLGLKIVNEGNI